MLCRRKFVFTMMAAPATAAFVAAPITFTATAPFLRWRSASAQGKGGGDGNQGNGNNSSSGGRNSGNSDRSDRGNGNKSNGRSRDNRDANDMGRAHRESSDRPVAPGTSRAAEMTDGSTVEVLHSNGMREKLGNGRYIMTDAQGRTIIDRAATRSDLERLQDMID